MLARWEVRLLEVSGYWDTSTPMQVNGGVRGVKITQLRMLDLQNSRETSINIETCVESDQQLVGSWTRDMVGFVDLNGFFLGPLQRPGYVTNPNSLLALDAERA